MPQDDGWDWPFLLYTATVLLHRTEKQFWRMSPRKLNALAKVHVEVNSSSDQETAEKPQVGYIDHFT